MNVYNNCVLEWTKRAQRAEIPAEKRRYDISLVQTEQARTKNLVNVR